MELARLKEKKENEENGIEDIEEEISEQALPINATSTAEQSLFEKKSTEN